MAPTLTPFTDGQNEPVSAAGSEVGTMNPFRRFLDKYFYLSMALLTVVIKVMSVIHTPGYPVSADERDSLIHPAPSRPLIIWLHNGVFSGWMVFFIFQSALERAQKIKWLQFFGWFGVGVGTLMVPVGIATAIVKGRHDIAMLYGTDPESFLIVPFFTVLAFGVFFALAVWWRKEPELHRRLIFMATCMLLDSAFGRFDIIYNHPYSYFVCVDLMIILGVLRDLFVNRRVHKVYLIAVPALVASQVFVSYTTLENSAWWMRIARAIIG